MYETHDDLPLLPANRAALAPEYPWPQGQRAAMFLSFDVDAETAWTGKDPSRYEELVTMSYGGYEARIGVRMLLAMLESLSLRATFFITGWSVEAHPVMAESILRAGHEIGHHGFHHLMPQPGDPRLVDEVDRALETLKRRLGVVPKGYRAPSGESCEELRVLLKERGLVYSSSWRDDVRPYRHLLADGRPGLIELPVTMVYDDWLFGLSHRYSPRPMMPKEHVLSIWKDELDEVRDWGGMVTTVLHPQCSGRPMRLRLLRHFLRYAQGHGDVWITTGEAIAAHYAACEAADTGASA
ncbi:MULTISPECIES: polysaccharide deacetylase family protein [Roseomonadaceae]|uniref:Chitooligosaccharide deacetylase n=1 Tax=Falsiroseomonas oleicola TaxID=2801474 RepID=A0ABS6H1I7_9PROT|nr:polysaccharide deacetylase [Roseomonas oleicola]MBU8542256.1 polysaccharide deacetylase [Roseomonas oleicola]